MKVIFIIMLILLVVSFIIIKLSPTSSILQCETYTLNKNDNVSSEWTRNFNPSIIKFGHDMLVIIRVEKGTIDIPSTFVVQKISQCDTSQKSISLSMPFEVHNNRKKMVKIVNRTGLEDARIFLYRNKVHSLVTVPTNNKTYIALVELSPTLAEIEKFVRLKSPYKNVMEKNWNPFIPEKKLFVTNLQPHTIVEVDMDTGDVDVKYETENNKLRKIYPRKFSLRGSTRYIEIDEGYLSIGHSVKGSIPFLKKYFHIFYLTEKTPPYRIINFSDPFKFPGKSGVQFASGLERVGNKLWISYGDNDRTAHISIVDLSSVMKLVLKN